MSRIFNAFCYIRVYSDDKKDFDKNVWELFALRDGSGFNYATKRLYFDLGGLDDALSKLIKLCGDSYAGLIGGNDDSEIYVCVDKREGMEHLNNSGISKWVIAQLCMFKAELVFSVEETFTEHKYSDFSFTV